MRHKIPTRRVALLLSMYGALLIFLASTSPKNLHPVLLIAPIAWLFVTVVLTLRLFNQSKPGSNEGSISATSRSLIIAGALAGLLLLQSIDQLTLKDILLLVLFSGLTLLYVKRFKLIQKRD